MKYFDDLIELIPDYRSIASLMFWWCKNGVDSLNERGFLKSDIIRLC